MSLYIRLAWAGIRKNGKLYLPDRCCRFYCPYCPYQNRRCRKSIYPV